MSITVDEVVKQLQELQAEGCGSHLVVMSKDGEGNSFSPFAELGTYMYRPESTWSGELVDKEEVDDDEYKENAVVLWPTN